MLKFEHVFRIEKAKQLLFPIFNYYSFTLLPNNLFFTLKSQRDFGYLSPAKFSEFRRAPLRQPRLRIIFFGKVIKYVWYGPVEAIFLISSLVSIIKKYILSIYFLQGKKRFFIQSKNSLKLSK